LFEEQVRQFETLQMRQFEVLLMTVRMSPGVQTVQLLFVWQLRQPSFVLHMTQLRPSVLGVRPLLHVEHWLKVSQENAVGDIAKWIAGRSK
jgi:hypothetical protein